VTAPSVPPSSHPLSATTTSIPVLITRSEPPGRVTSPVISPSRGPAPSRAPMYRAVASAFSAIPAVASAIRTHSAPGAGRTASTASTTTPTRTTLLRVPTPGRSRSGTQHSSTSAPTTMVTVPSDQSSRRARPWCSTSHGMTPSEARTSSAIEIPKPTRPA
jgi:hypothetical protein